MTCQYRLSISISTGAYLTFYEGRDKGGSNCAAPNMLFLKMAIFCAKKYFFTKKNEFLSKKWSALFVSKWIYFSRNVE